MYSNIKKMNGSNKLNSYSRYVRGVDDRVIIAHELNNKLNTTTSGAMNGFFVYSNDFGNVEETKDPQNNKYLYTLEVKRNVNVKVFVHMFGDDGNSYVLIYRNSERIYQSENIHRASLTSPIVFDFELQKGDKIGLHNSVTTSTREMWITLND